MNKARRNKRRKMRRRLRHDHDCVYWYDLSAEVKSSIQAGMTDIRNGRLTPWEDDT